MDITLFLLDSLQVECKAVMVFFHYCVMSNYFWLFIEGLYLFTLLVETFFPERRYFYWYTIIGWGMWHFLCKMCVSVQKSFLLCSERFTAGTGMNHLVFHTQIQVFPSTDSYTVSYHVSFSLCLEVPLQTKLVILLQIDLNWNHISVWSCRVVFHNSKLSSTRYYLSTMLVNIIKSSVFSLAHSLRPPLCLSPS